MKRLFNLLAATMLLVAGSVALQAQPVSDSDGDVVVGDDVATPTAILDLVSTTKGMLVPRMTTAQRDAIVNPAEALMIYNTDDWTHYVYSSASGAPQWDAFVTTGNHLGWLTAGNVDLVNGVNNFLGTTDATPVRMVTNSSERVRIAPDGDVGVNQTSPSAQFDVVGDNNEPAIEANVPSRTAIVARSSTGTNPNPGINTGVFAAVPGGPNNSAVIGLAGNGAPFSSQAGVVGSADGGYGVAGNSVSSAHAGVFGLASSVPNPAIGVLGRSRRGRAGRFEIIENLNTSNAVEISTVGSGAALVVSATGGGPGIVSRGNVIPNSTNTYDLGSNTNRWNEIYVNGLASIHLGVAGDEAHITYNPATDIMGFDFQGTSAPEVSFSDNGTVTARAFFGFGAIPIRGIIMWSGSIGSIPTGWALCNGGSGTPDLRNRFVVGAGSTYSPGNTGGVSSQNLGHGHSIATNSAGAHTHNIPFSFGLGRLQPTLVLGGETTTTSSGTHSHTGATTTAGLGNVTNLPPYYALAYIMRVQ